MSLDWKTEHIVRAGAVVNFVDSSLNMPKISAIMTNTPPYYRSRKTMMARRITSKNSWKKPIYMGELKPEVCIRYIH